MKVSKKTIIIIAVILVIAGAVISSSVFMFSDFKYSDLSDSKSETNTHIINESFDNISVSSGAFDVNFFYSDDNECKVICKESDKIRHSVSVENNTLTIKEDETEWFDHINFMVIEKYELNVYLPENVYETLDINCSSGDITVPGNFNFNKNADISVSSGDVNFDGHVKGNLEITATSGDIKITGAEANEITASVTSGDIRCVNVTAFNRLNTTATSGDITVKDSTMDYFYNSTTSGSTDLINTTVDYDINMESTSGDITLERCDADSLELSSTSGNIEGSLLSSKIFSVDTNSGDIDIPDSVSGGKCDVETTSGNIDFEICG
ncbi:MAG: DUF4097 family beta strand repeat protein [Oscillospiraceae bacterium]|nr:DUF4097 family beta strand repeat protein [Oscillospiraceae bacterium]